jgi:hypothetical protein
MEMEPTHVVFHHDDAEIIAQFHDKKAADPVRKCCKRTAECCLQPREVKAAPRSAGDVKGGVKGEFKGEFKGEHDNEHQTEADEHTISADQVLARFDSTKNGTKRMLLFM